MSEYLDPDDSPLKRLLQQAYDVRLRTTGFPASSSPVGSDEERVRSVRENIPDRFAEPLASSRRVAEARIRLLVALSCQPGGERRQARRWPARATAQLSLDGYGLPAEILDIGSGGALLARFAEIEPNRDIDIEFALGSEIARHVRLIIDTEALPHLAFEPGHQTEDAFRHWLDDCAIAGEVAVWQAMALANAVEAVLESALREEIVTLGALLEGFDGNAPSLTAFQAVALRFYETALPPVLLEATGSEAEAFDYIVATDSHGYVRADPLGLARAGDPALRRHRRRFGDAVTLRAARFSNGPVVQTYRRLPGQEPIGVVRDVAAPVMVRGRRWGCVQIGRALPRLGKA